MAYLSSPSCPVKGQGLRAQSPQLSLSQSLSSCLCLTVSLSISVSLSLSLSPFLCLYLSVFLCICLCLSVSLLPDTYFLLKSDGFQFLVNTSFIWCVMWSFWVGYIFFLRLLASWLNFLGKLFSSHSASRLGPWSQCEWEGVGWRMSASPPWTLLGPAGVCRGSWFSQIVLGMNERGRLSINRNLKLGLADLPNKNTKCLVKFDIR